MIALPDLFAKGFERRVDIGRRRGDGCFLEPQIVNPVMDAVRRGKRVWRFAVHHRLCFVLRLDLFQFLLRLFEKPQLRRKAPVETVQRPEREQAPRIQVVGHRFLLGGRCVQSVQKLLKLFRTRPDHFGGESLHRVSCLRLRSGFGRCGRRRRVGGNGCAGTLRPESDKGEKEDKQNQALKHCPPEHHAPSPPDNMNGGGISPASRCSIPPPLPLRGTVPR